MPSVVVRIPVQIGEHVKKGQSVIVVSAMKMETTLCAPFDGTVVKINVAVNDKVAPGQILVEIEKEGRWIAEIRLKGEERWNKRITNYHAIPHHGVP